jgi:hypothetical protein
MHDASLRHRAVLRSAGVALACERFRQARGRWPDSLAELPKHLLPAVPLDPFDGQPLKYVRRPVGVTVYSVGFDETDNGGNVPETTPSAGWQEPGLDLGFRLFDPDQRGLPPVRRTIPLYWPNGWQPAEPAEPVALVPREVGGPGR